VDNQLFDINEQTARTIGWTVLACVAAVLLAGWWYTNTHYTSSYDNNFLVACEDKGASAITCGCALGVVKQNYTFEQAKALDTLGSLPGDLSTMVSNQCS
jgi:hypothetical protein